MPLTLDQIKRTTEAGELPADAVATVLNDVTRYLLGAGAITLDQAFGFVSRQVAIRGLPKWPVIGATRPSAILAKCCNRSAPHPKKRTRCGCEFRDTGR